MLIERIRQFFRLKSRHRFQSSPLLFFKISMQNCLSSRFPVYAATHHAAYQYSKPSIILVTKQTTNFSTFSSAKKITHPATIRETCSSTNILTCQYSSDAAHHSTKSAPFCVTIISTVSSFSFAVHQLPSHHDAHSHNRRGNPQHNLTMATLPCNVITT